MTSASATGPTATTYAATVPAATTVPASGCFPTYAAGATYAADALVTATHDGVTKIYQYLAEPRNQFCGRHTGHLALATL